MERKTLDTSDAGVKRIRRELALKETMEAQTQRNLAAIRSKYARSEEKSKAEEAKRISHQAISDARKREAEIRRLTNQTAEQEKKNAAELKQLKQKVSKAQRDLKKQEAEDAQRAYAQEVEAHTLAVAKMEKDITKMNVHQRAIAYEELSQQSAIMEKKTAAHLKELEETRAVTTGKKKQAELDKQIAEESAKLQEYSSAKESYEEQAVKFSKKSSSVNVQLNALWKDDEQAKRDQKRPDLQTENKEVEATLQNKLSRKAAVEEDIKTAQAAKLDTSSLEAELRTLNTSIKENQAVIAANTKELGGLDELDSIAESISNAKKMTSDKGRKELAVKKTNQMREDTAAKNANRRANREAAKTAEYKEVNKERVKEEFKDNSQEALLKGLENLGNKLNDFTKAIDDNINSFYQYQSSIDARLQGSNETYQKALNVIKKNVGISGLVKQTDVIENLKTLSESGIAYNLELRAFLATISDDIAETFDVFDGNLARLIRLQQADTTAARLGMESSLNQLFNKYFSDTSYLSDVADNVSQAIIEANSQLTRDMSIEFEYIVQKWLGSLYSLGMDSNTINTIAQGLNYLGTGNVSALNSNDSLQSLLAMSATKAGIPYGDILTGGLDAKTTNELMKSMVEYLKSIAENTDNNQVTKSAYSNVFGFSMSDLTAISSMSAQDITNLYNESLDYTSAMQEYTNQANSILSRTHASTMLEKVFDNAVLTSSTTIGSNLATYGTWKVLNIIEDLTGGIPIPAVSVMGNMVDLHQTVTGLAKAGIGGVSLMGSLLSSMFNGGNMFGTFDYNAWGYDAFTKHNPGGIKGISKGTASGSSGQTSFSLTGSSDANDIKKTSLQDATDEAEEDSKITNANVEENNDVYERIYSAIADDSTTVLAEVIALSALVADSWAVTNSLLREDRLFQAEMGGIDTLLSLIGPNRVFITQAQAAQASQAGVAAQSIAFMVDTAESLSAYSTTVLADTATEVAAFSNMVDDSIRTIADTTAIAQQSITTSSQSAAQTITRMQSEQRAVDIDTINQLEAQTAIGVTTNTNSSDQLNSLVSTDNGLKVSIAEMSPEVSSYISNNMRSMITSALLGDVTSDDEKTTLIQQLAELLKSQQFNVSVKNDDFDTLLHKWLYSF